MTQNTKAAALVSLAIMSEPLNAALVSSDYLNPGDRLIVSDTSSGLEWINFTAANQTNDLTQLITQYEGFHLADRTQLKTLWDQYLSLWQWDPLPLQPYMETAGPGNKMNQALTFQAAFGWGTQDGVHRTTYFTVGNNGNPDEMIGFRVNTRNGFPDNVDMYYNNGYYRPLYNDDDIAYALVRFSTEQNPTIPEPAPLALMALGFAGMGYLQRRRKPLQA